MIRCSVVPRLIRVRSLLGSPVPSGDGWDRLMAWFSKHAKPRSCQFCEYVHEGRMDYVNHLVSDHPKKWEEFKAVTGIK